MRLVMKTMMLAAMPVLLAACTKSATSVTAPASSAGSLPAAGGAATSGSASGSGSGSGGPLASKSAGQIQSEVDASLKVATSFRVRGTLSGGGPAVKFDFTHAPGRCKGTLTLSGSTEDFIEIGADFWLRVAGTGGGYLHDNADAKTFKTYLYYCDPAQLVSTFGSLPVASKGPVAVVDGVRTLELLTPGAGETFVTDSMFPQLVRIDLSAGAVVDFSGINAPATINPPS